MAPAEIRAVFEFADPIIVGQRNGIIVWELRRKAHSEETDASADRE